jgi:hypothetical protein
MKLTDTTLAKILFLLFLLAAMIFPSKSVGQAKPERPDWLISDDSIRPDPNMNCCPTPTLGEISKDTVSVRVLCEVTSGLDWLGSTPMAVFMTKNLERTFEVQEVTIPPTQNKDGSYYPIHVTMTKPVQISQRYLHPVEGCYQIIPLTNEK